MLPLIGAAALAGCAQPPAPAAGRASRPVPPAVAEPVRLPPPKAAQALIAATPAQVVAMLGRPSLRRVDGPAEVWLYSADRVCRLDLVFYRDGAALRVAAATAHPAARDVAEARCLQAIAAL